MIYVYFSKNIFIILLCSINVLVKCQSGKPNFRILAPQFICGAPKPEANQTALPVAPPGATTIRLQTASGQSLSYNWTIRFNILDSPRGQRFNLMVWRAVRGLERTLTDMSPIIAETNMVAINNTMLVKGVNYVFNVSGVNKNNIVSEPKSFSIKFDSESKDAPKLNFEGSTSNDKFSVLMLGSEVTYADVLYVVEAQAQPCEPTNDYYFGWTVVDSESRLDVNVGKQMGKQLKIPAGTLVGGEKYDVDCKIISISNGELITKNGLFLSVLKKGMTVELNTEKMSIASKSPVYLLAILKNPDNIRGKLFFEWSCKISVDMSNCPNFKSMNTTELNIEGGFPDDETYIIDVTVTKGNSKASKTCVVVVQTGMLPSIELGALPRAPVAGRALELQARVLDLRPGCNLRWLPVKEKGYAYLDPALVPGGFGSSMSINSKDETFLSEIVEFGNETLERSFPLVVPAASEGWPGLQADSTYRFRLLAECTCTRSVQCEGPKNVTAFSDVVFTTNAPPVPKPLKVKPISGTALKTVFTFSTSAAADSLKDYPLRYTFGYKTPSGDETIIATYIENLNADTILPYSEVSFIPTMQVCDSRGACADIVGDPIVTLKPAVITPAELTALSDKFQKHFFRKEYVDGFALAGKVFQTLTAMNDETSLNQFKTMFESITLDDIAKQMVELKNKSSIATSNDFIVASTKFIKTYPVSDAFLQEILKLRDAVFEVASQSNNVKSSRLVSYSYIVDSNSNPMENCQFRCDSVDSSQTPKVRKKRDLSPDDVKNFLKVSEFIILTSNDETQINTEKKKVVTKVKISASDLCKTATKDATIIDTKIVFMSVEISNIRQNMRVVIPYYPRVGYFIGLQSIAYMQLIFLSDTQITGVHCLSKNAFSLNVLEARAETGQKGWVYQAEVYSGGNGNSFQPLYNVIAILKLPAENISVQADEVLQCRRWKDSTWDENSCETNENIETINKIGYVVCKCDSLGYFSLFVLKKSSIPSNLSPSLPTETMIDPDINPSATIIPAIDGVDPLQSSLTTVFPSVVHIEPSETVQPENFTKIDLTNEDDTNLTLTVSVALLMTAGVVLVMLGFAKKKLAARNKTGTLKMAASKESTYAVPKYRRFYAEDMMDGTAESLAKYNIEMDDL